MTRIGLNLAVALMTFFVGTTGSILRNRWTSHSRKAETVVASGQISGEPLKVAMQVHACGPRANYHSFYLSDGTRISTSCEDHGSRSAATRALQRKLSAIGEIIDRAPNLDEKGRRVGDKVLAKGRDVTKLETHGTALCSTYAVSLEHLQWFEHR